VKTGRLSPCSPLSAPANGMRIQVSPRNLLFQARLGITGADERSLGILIAAMLLPRQTAAAHRAVFACHFGWVSGRRSKSIDQIESGIYSGKGQPHIIPVPTCGRLFRPALQSALLTGFSPLNRDLPETLPGLTPYGVCPFIPDRWSTPLSQRLWKQRMKERKCCCRRTTPSPSTH
jgi:hypothetical protein